MFSSTLITRKSGLTYLKIQSRCKDCIRLWRKEYYLSNPNKLAEKLEGDRERMKDPAFRAKKAAAAMRSFHKNKDKWYARNKLKYAVRTGKILRLPCEMCGNPKSQGHHDDYSKPLEVKWLCSLHHKQVEGKLVNNYLLDPSYEHEGKGSDGK